jgi:hypothetical protein
MSNRVTWRSRPRSEYPWPIPTARLEALPEAYPEPDYLIGPLPMHALCELLFRANGFTAGDATGQYLDSPTEENMLERAWNATVYPSSFAGFYAWAVGDDWGFEFTLFESGVDPWDGHDDDREIFIYDVAGEFYLRGRIAISGPDGDRAGNWNVDAMNGPVTITLKMKSGDFPITAYGDFSPDFIVSSWLPYATRDGSPAWNTTTGAAINGGPGS